MSIQEYGRQVLDKGKQEIKNQIMKKLLPILLKYVAPVVIVLIILISIFMGLFGGIEASAEESEMTPATGSAWEQFIRYLHQCEYGGESIKNEEGIDCYIVKNGAVGYGVDIQTHGAKLRALGYSTTAGSLIPVTDVDAIEKEEREERYNQVLNLATTNGINLTQYQLFALTSRTYNYGFAGGTGQATSSFIYPSTLTFVEAYKEYYEGIDNQNYYGDYTKTDFNNGLYTQYMTWLDYAPGNSMGGTPYNHPAGWETRRKSEWCLFQTGYYGWGLQNGGAYPEGFDEYWQESTTFSGDLYNEDGSVNEEKIAELQKSFESKYNLVEGNLSGNNIGGVYNPSACKQVTGDYLKWDGNVYSSGATYRGENGLGIYQCTWWANGRASQYLGKQFDVNGNGGEIFGNAQGKYKTGSTPKPNSLVSYYKNKTDGSSTTGHVAYVEAVDNQYYYISHCGSGKSWYGIQKVEIGKAPWNGWYTVGFVYLD